MRDITKTTYDSIGNNYAEMRRPDRRIAKIIRNAIGSARTAVNIGAGTGNYEPTDIKVLAVEPSSRMISQRPINSAPVVKASAEQLPCGDGEFDASLAILTIHHWSDWAKGLSEMRRVAPRQVIFTFDPKISNEYWLIDYFPEMVYLDANDLPTPKDIEQHLNVKSIDPVLIPSDCTDGFFASYWKRPSAYLSEQVRASMSPFALLDPGVQARGLAHLESDLSNGKWEAKYRYLHDAQSLDCGYRLLIAED